MTINGGKAHAVGDRGQRYEITYFDMPSEERRVFGWSETREKAERIVRAMSRHPSWTLFQIEDRDQESEGGTNG